MELVVTDRSGNRTPLNHIRDLFAPSLGKFKVLPIAGQPKEISTYVAAPKTEWGYKVISDINEALSKLKSNPAYINEGYMWRDLPKSL